MSRTANSTDVIRKVIEILSDVSGKDEDSISQEDRLFADLGIDSIDRMQLAMQLEEEFEEHGISVENDLDCSIWGEHGHETEDMTVGQVADIICQKINIT